ncbi:hypothetical protein Bhyg_04585 [Pseudolycoriella hygida]|uniref:Uncharacterized protein n=1 Tax=Pseudolycoriella hygida TaxID=35572 RepID=A0A9Q0NGZ0_9DIPT|nr:hypothetical protein Bhyg_04585 [Pseudolycoriella hygida]
MEELSINHLNNKLLMNLQAGNFARTNKYSLPQEHAHETDSHTLKVERSPLLGLKNTPLLECLARGVRPLSYFHVALRDAL